LSTAAEKINVDLKDHQIHVKNWDHKSLIRNLHIWTERFIFEFKLQCTVPALRLDRLRSNVYGRYRIGRNGFGLLNEITINEQYINEDIVNFHNLGTLLDELLHGEQQVLGTEGKTEKSRNYHNIAFIDKAKSFGLIVDHYGHQKYAPPPTPFSELLAKYGIKIPVPSDNEPVEIMPTTISSGNSKLKLWVCACKPKPIHVRVAISDFRAKCLKCGRLFRHEVRSEGQNQYS